ncbi:MAG: hypothetical protein KM296_06905 [Brockia lithotrophica]|nr:hypothetical protein [Brockia lithotrophica]
MPVRRIVGKSVEEAMARARAVYGDRAFLLESRRRSASPWSRLLPWRREGEVELLLYVPDGFEGEGTLGERVAPSGKLRTFAGTSEPGVRVGGGGFGTAKGEAAASPSGDVLRELEDLRRFVERLAEKAPPEYPEDFAVWADRLRARGVGEALLATLYEAYREEDGDPREKLLRAFRARFAPAVWRGRVRDRPTVFAFVGPTGVGKTTTLAKLAGQAVLRGMRVALLTADTYRMAAVEQLGKYAGILGAPMAVVRTPEEVERVLGEWGRERELILFDTSGRNYFEEDPGRTMELLAPARSRGAVYAFLVVSATQMPSDLEALFSRFADYAPDGLVLTKVDETRTPGHVLDLVLRGRLPLAFLACGQSVPFDLARASPDLLLELFLTPGPVREACSRFKDQDVFLREGSPPPFGASEQGGDSHGRL